MAETKTKKGNGWHKGMSSPNPKGRPKGIVDKRALVSKALMDDANQIVKQVVAKAKAGDLQAANIVLSRVLPTLSSQTERFTFDLDASAPLSFQVEQIVKAISEGKVPPDIAKQIIESVGALGAIRQQDELERRMAALEGGTGTSSTNPVDLIGAFEYPTDDLPDDVRIPAYNGHNLHVQIKAVLR